MGGLDHKANLDRSVKGGSDLKKPATPRANFHQKKKKKKKKT